MRIEDFGLGIAAGVLRVALGQPVEAGVGGEADREFPMLGAGTLEKNFRGHTAGTPDLTGAGRVANRAAAGRAFKQFF